MAKLLADYRTEISRLIKDGAAILSVPGDIDVVLLRALEQYNKRVPRKVVLDVTSDGTGEVAISALTGFDEEFSGDPEIEYPISTSGKPNLIERRYWQFYRKPTGLVIRFDDAVSSGADIRFNFNALHTVTALATTVPESDFYALCKLAAAEGCDDLSRHFTQTAEKTFIQADSASYNTKAREYESRAKRLREQFNSHVGAGANDEGVQAASVTKNWDTTNSLGGDRLTHRKRYR
jgi:hypothetical protein